MKTNCPMKRLLQELIDNKPVRNQETIHECCLVLFMEYLITTHEPQELIEAIRKVIER